MSTTYPAGWYPDANYPGYERYFDGNAWTPHTRVAPQQQQQQQQHAPTQAYPSIITSVPNAAQAHAYAQPYAQAAVAPRNKGARVPLIIVGSVFGGFLLLIFLLAAIGGASSNSARPAADRPAAVTTPAPTPSPTEEVAAEAPAEAPPAPAADGTVASPFPAPHILANWGGVEQYVISAKVVNADANAAVMEWNMFNDEAPAGYKYVIVEVTMTGKNPDGVEPRYEQSDMELATAEGNGYDDEWIVFADGTQTFRDGPTLYPEQSFTGLMAFIVPADAASFLFKVDGQYIAMAG